MPKKMKQKQQDPTLMEVDRHLNTLGAHWKETVKELQFQLPGTDARGLPANIHLLDTLRKALALYQEAAAWSHVESKLKGRF
jgi:hypothetical protein